MKIRILTALAGLLAAPLAYSSTQPLITKSSGSGFTAPEFSRSETCEVFMNHVVITQRFGFPDELGFTKRETRRISLDRSIQNVLDTAAKEELVKKDNFLCDAPGTTVQIRGNPEPVVLFASGGCGSPRLDRGGPAAVMLKDLVDQYCPVTNDFGRRD